MQVNRLRSWRAWEADAETVIELCGEGGEGDEEVLAMLDEAMEVQAVQQCFRASGYDNVNVTIIVHDYGQIRTDVFFAW